MGICPPKALRLVVNDNTQACRICIGLCRVQKPCIPVALLLLECPNQAEAGSMSEFAQQQISMRVSERVRVNSACENKERQGCRWLVKHARASFQRLTVHLQVCKLLRSLPCIQ